VTESLRLIPMSRLSAEKGIDYSRVHLYRLMKAGQFPKPIHLGGNRIAFLESEIDSWIRAKIEQRDNNQAAA